MVVTFLFENKNVTIKAFGADITQLCVDFVAPKFIVSREKKLWEQIMYDIEFVIRMTKTTKKQRERMIEIYATADEEMRLQLIEEQVKINRRLRGEYYTPDRNVEYIYGCVILSIKSSLSRSAIARKHANLNLRLVDELRAKSAIKNREGRKQRAIRLRYYKLILNLKEDEKLTWNEIAKYLSQHHRFKVSPGFLQQVMLSLRKAYTEPLQ